MDSVKSPGSGGGFRISRNVLRVRKGLPVEGLGWLCWKEPKLGLSRMNLTQGGGATSPCEACKDAKPNPEPRCS